MKGEIKIDGREVETLFKVAYPIMPVEEGHGYTGVLLSDKDTKELQCHICGEWFDYLYAHIFNRHKMPVKEYKKKYQLPLNFPLCSKTVSEKKHSIAISTVDLKRLKKMAKKNGKFTKKIPKWKKQYAMSNMAMRNMRGACPEQIKDRYLVVADIVERDPSKRDIAEHDPGLLWAIRSYYGNLNNFRKKSGFEVRGGKAPVETAKIIAAIRKIYFNIHKIPTQKHFEKEKVTSVSSVIRRFGSWNRAIASAGILRNAA